MSDEQWGLKNGRVQGILRRKNSTQIEKLNIRLAQIEFLLFYGGRLLGKKEARRRIN